MPMIDAFIPAAALAREVEEAFVKERIEILLKHEANVGPDTPRAQAVSLLFLHRPVVFVAGAPAAEPRYRFIASVPEGQLVDDDVCNGLVREVTEAVARAEGTNFEDVSLRVRVSPTEIPDGCCGGRGAIRRLPEILQLLAGEEAAREGAERLARRQEARALEMLRVGHRHAELMTAASTIRPVTPDDRDTLAVIYGGGAHGDVEYPFLDAQAHEELEAAAS